MTSIRALIGRQVDRYFTGRRLEQAAANQTTSSKNRT